MKKTGNVIKKMLMTLIGFILLATTDFAFARHSAVFETEFNTNQFRSKYFNRSVKELRDIRGKYIIRSQYQISDLTGNPYRSTEETERNCSDSANGHCTEIKYLTVYTQAKITITKELYSVDKGELISNVEHDYKVILRGRNRIESFHNPHPALPTEISLFKVSSFDTNELQNHLALKFFDYYLIDIGGSTSRSFLTVNTNPAYPNFIARVKYNKDTGTILSTAGLVINLTSSQLENFVALHDTKPITDDDSFKQVFDTLGSKVVANYLGPK